MASGLAANPVFVSIKPVRIWLEHGEVPVRNLAAVEIGWWGGMQTVGYEGSQFGWVVVVVELVVVVAGLGGGTSGIKPRALPRNDAI